MKHNRMRRLLAGVTAAALLAAPALAAEDTAPAPQMPDAWAVGELADSYAMGLVDDNYTTYIQSTITSEQLSAMTGIVADKLALLELPQREGKLSAAGLRTYLEGFYGDENHEHMVFPGMVYLSWPTELGTLYTRAELGEIHKVCRQYKIPLYLDGARMGYGLASRGSGMTLADLAASCDVFYIGGTKVGALFGEAVVFPRHNAPGRFMTAVKQRGALLAKGWLLGVQFDALFTDGLYQKLGKNAIETAERLREGFQEKGFSFYLDTPTNQIFLVVDRAQREDLARKAAFSFWEQLDEERTVIRFVTSWATRMEDVEELIRRL